MRIANIMFSRGLGGIEQCFLDYNEALQLAGHEVLAITHPLAQINPQMEGDIQTRTLANLGSWDSTAGWKLSQALKSFQPHATVTHGNRGLKLVRKAKKHAGLHIGVTHNYNLKHFDQLDLVFAITKDLQHHAVEAGALLTHIVRIPNMVHLPDYQLNRTLKPEGEPLIIGAMGRFVEKKGFDQLIEAATKLKALTRQPFKIVIGGDGEEKKNLEQLIKQHQLEETVQLYGWVEDKIYFFNNCDIFCLPSLHEPFGIVLLEAMAHGVPIVSYESEGPHEIYMEHPDAALLAKTGDTGALADRLARLLNNPVQREFLSKQGILAVEQEFSIPIVSRKIDAALNRFIHL